MLLVYISIFIKKGYSNILFKNESNEDDSEHNNLNSSSGSNYENNLNSGPEKDPDDEDFIKKTISNKNLIIVNPKKIFIQKYLLNSTMLKTTPVSYIYNLSEDKELILKEFKNKSGIYLIHNNVNGKQYIGSGMDLSKRLATYYFPSRLSDNRYISNSILKYGHSNFSVVILYILGNTGLQTKMNILNKEQYHIDLYKPVLNLNPTAGSSMGFKHSEESKKLISEFRKGKPLSESTKKRLSILFSGELNPFWSKTHSADTLSKMSKSKKGELNPMFNKEKSKEFIEHMNKNRKGINNPMFGKSKSEDTLAKIRKKVYIYDKNKEFIKLYDSVGEAVKELHVSSETIKKYLNTNKLYKDKYFYSELQ